MTETDPTWEEHNNAFLRAALDWLRLRVSGTVAPPAPAGPPSLPVAPNATAPLEIPVTRRRADGGWRRRRPDATPEPGHELLPTPPAAPPDDPAAAALRDAARAVDAAAAGEPPPALEVLARRMGLSRFERDVLLLAVAPEFDTSFGRLYGEAQGDPARGRATFALAMAALEEPHWAALAPHRPLRRFELVTLGGSDIDGRDGDGGDGAVTARLTVPERVANFIKGLSHLDGRLAHLLAPFDLAEPPEPAPSQLAAVREIVRRAAHPDGGLVNLVGADRPSKHLVAAAAAARLDLRLIRIPVANLPTGVHELARLSRLLDREQLLSPVALYLDAGDDGPEPVSGAGPVDRVVAGASGLVLLDSREPWPGLPPRGAIVDVARPTPTEQRATWQRLLGDERVAAATAAEFDLDLALIHTLAAGTAGVAGDERAAALRRDCRARCRPRLGRLAERLIPGSDEPVLSPDVAGQLQLLEHHVRLRSTVLDDWGLAGRSTRGLGVTALFCGEPGVGKTMAAEVLARRLDLDLYRIDLSGVVSKYIGETEKNLRAVFDAVDRGGSILFFDEADALFGKRSEVRDSHDRYANIEVSYLLARMEMHRGLAVLATNMKRGLDDAFARRLRISIDFPFPSEDERAAIWARSFPPGTPLQGVDHRRLARLSLAGGAIRNVAINAAFLGAAADPQVVTMSTVLFAARLEYRKLGLPASAADFEWTGDLVPAGSGSPS